MLVLQLGSPYGLLVCTLVLSRCLGVVLCRRNKVVFDIYCRWKAIMAALRTIVSLKITGELMNWQRRFVCLSVYFLVSFFLCLSILFAFFFALCRIDMWGGKGYLYWPVSPSPLPERSIRLFTCYPGLCWRLRPWSLSNRLWLWIIPACLKTEVLLLK